MNNKFSIYSINKIRRVLPPLCNIKDQNLNDFDTKYKSSPLHSIII